MNSTDAAINTENLVKIYKENSAHPVRALDNLSLSVRQGEIFGLLGENGAGKTTLLRILTTLVRPTSGRATLMGLDVSRRAYDVRKKICAVLQENAVEVYLSVEDNLKTYARFHSIPSREREARVDRAIEQFGLGENRKQKVIDLSGGLKRRVQVAKVFMVDKPVVFLDEATTGRVPRGRVH
jgi:ABC-2 type transport system ATP-binding protein